MRQRDMVAVMPDQGALNLPPELIVARADGIAVILAKRGLQLRRGRKALAQAALRRQLWLEALLPQGTVLPALPGARLTEAEVPALVAANRALFDQLAKDLTGQVQFQLSILCDAKAACAAMQARPGPWRGATSAEQWTRAFDTHLRRQLGTVPLTGVEALPRAGDVVVNLAVLLPAAQEPLLDAILQEIDALWSDGLTIRLTGPSPAVSFASVGLKPVTRHALTAAAALLGLDGPAVRREAIQAARHSALKAGGAPPAEIRAAADCLARAQALEAPGPYPMAFVWSEGQTAPAQADAA